MNRDPFIPTLRYEVDRLFDFVLKNTWGARSGDAAWMPPADVCETAEFYRIEVDLPGVRHGDLSIAAHGRSLELKGTRERRRQEGGPARSCLTERPAGSFARSFQLPEDADAQAIRARLEEGVLTIEIPRTGSSDRRAG
jgi:HSP20 family protein